MHIAARDGKIEMIQLLLSEGADQMMRDSNQQCPIKLAVLSEQIEALQILLRYGQFWSFFFIPTSNYSLGSHLLSSLRLILTTLKHEL